MPIESKKTAYEFDEKPAEMEELEEVEAETPEGETATLSLALLGGQQVKPGDTIRLEVVESSADDGTVTVKYAKPAPKGEMGMAAEFDKPPMKGMV